MKAINSYVGATTLLIDFISLKAYTVSTNSMVLFVCPLVFTFYFQQLIKCRLQISASRSASRTRISNDALFYSEENPFFFRIFPGVSPRYFLQKLVKCWAEEKLSSSIISERGMYDIDSRYLMRSARFCINH